MCARTYNNAHWNESSKFYRARKFKESGLTTKQAMGKTTRKNACSQETMMKKRSVIIFTITQVALAREHTSRRSAGAVTVNTADGAIRCNPNTGTHSLSNSFRWWRLWVGAAHLWTWEPCNGRSCHHGRCVCVCLCVCVLELHVGITFRPHQARKPTVCVSGVLSVVRAPCHRMLMCFVESSRISKSEEDTTEEANVLF